MDSILLTLAADVVAVLIALFALFRWRVRRRRVDVRLHPLTHYGPDGRERHEVAVQIITGDEPVLIEGVGVEFVGRDLKNEVWSAARALEGEVPNGWPDPFPDSRDGARVDSYSARTFRLGEVTVRQGLISLDGTVELRPTALLWRPSTARPRPAWMYKWSKRRAKRAGLAGPVRVSPSLPGTDPRGILGPVSRG
ncbi:hypothetical protein [Cellulosimicrobium protaetiae]|uniref:Uncharacterized protein n=1 Tax=Cellulosimicrobium protaetiae TaxID=2587808 RepID=A0A6M5UL14_9MICO|nr:hypothetical protein [Cellulosimicrobium protaetiae]QJW38684.1 hypothetical protein FIC82_020055 [Cellulosimicrobium protaetiae]